MNTDDIKMDAQYFIDKFSKIPIEKWTTQVFELDGACCALGHCGARFDFGTNLSMFTPEANALKKIFDDAQLPSIPWVNDYKMHGFEQKNPRDRILAALELAKKGKYNEQV